MKKEAVAADAWMKEVAASTSCAHDVLHNGAVVLRDYLVERQARRPRRGKRGIDDGRRTNREARRRAR
jgi:hypothetical protein